MLEDALKNLFPYKEISLKTGDTVQTEKCFYVGSGALSKIVIFRGDLYANIAGETKITGKSSKDLLVLDALAGGIKTLRINWREWIVQDTFYTSTNIT